MDREELRNHQCDPDESWAEYDAQGIYLCRVCPVCEKAKLAGYRPEILSGYSQADVDEDIEPEDWSAFEDGDGEADFCGYADREEYWNG